MTALISRPLLTLNALCIAGTFMFGCSSSDDDESPPCRDCVYPGAGGGVSPPSGPIGSVLPSAGGSGNVVGGTGTGTETGGTTGGTVGGAFGGMGGDMMNPISVGGSVGFGGDGSFVAGGTLGFGTTGGVFSLGATGGT
jgi:hypothetical protein